MIKKYEYMDSQRNLKLGLCSWWWWQSAVARCRGGRLVNLGGLKEEKNIPVEFFDELVLGLRSVSLNVPIYCFLSFRESGVIELWIIVYFSR